MLTGKNVDIRLYRPADKPKILAVKQRKEVPACAGLVRLSPLLEPLDLFERPWTKNYLVCKKNKEIIGLIRLDLIRRSEKCLLLVLDLWGEQADNQEGLKLAVKDIFESRGFARVYTHVLPADKNLIGVLENLAFQKEVVLTQQVYRQGKFEDVLIYGLVKDDF